ncbi:hypothetical protein N2152v2_004568 [Parachlorella kessleri]
MPALRPKKRGGQHAAANATSAVQAGSAHAEGQPVQSSASPAVQLAQHSSKVLAEAAGAPPATAFAAPDVQVQSSQTSESSSVAAAAADPELRRSSTPRFHSFLGRISKGVSGTLTGTLTRRNSSVQARAGLAAAPSERQPQQQQEQLWQTAPPRVLHVKDTTDLSDDGGDNDEDDDEFDEDEVDEFGGGGKSSDEDIVAEGETVGSHSGRVLSPINHTTKLQVGVLEGTTFLNQYVVVDTLGRGTYGNVKLCLNVTDDTLYAVKAVNKKLLRRQAQSGRTLGRNPVDDLKREVEVMRALDHPNLIKLREVIEDKEGGKVLMVLEYASGGALVKQDQLTREHHMPEPMAQYYFKHIVAGLAHLHANRVVHGDLKPENVLLSGDGTLKIADFGQSQFFEKKDTFNRTLGTPAFLRECGSAPEVCAGGAYHGRDADMWALGVSLFLFVYGELPFKADSIADLYDAIAEAKVEYPDYVQPSQDCMDLMQALLQPDPAQRVTSAEILHHPWIQGTYWKNLLPDAENDPMGTQNNPGAGNTASPEDYAALVFPEIDMTELLQTAATAPNGGLLESSPSGPSSRSSFRTPMAPLVEALLSTNRALRGRMASRVRRFSRLRTLANSGRGALRRGAGAIGSTFADLRPDLRPAHSCTSSFARTGSSGLATDSTNSRDSTLASKSRRGGVGGVSGTLSGQPSVDSPPQRALERQQGSRESSASQGSSAVDAQQAQHEGGSGKAAAAVHWPAAGGEPSARAMSTSSRQFSLEGPFAIPSTEGPLVGPAAASSRAAPAAQAAAQPSSQNSMSAAAPNGTPAGGGAGMAAPGGAALYQGTEPSGEFWEDLQTVQTCPPEALAAVGALQRVFHTAATLKRQQLHQMELSGEHQPAGLGEGGELPDGTSAVSSHNPAVGGGGQTDGQQWPRQQRPGSGTSMQPGQEPGVESMNSAELATAEAFEGMVALLQAAEAEQQAQQGAAAPQLVEQWVARDGQAAGGAAAAAGQLQQQEEVAGTGLHRQLPESGAQPAPQQAAAQVAPTQAGLGRDGSQGLSPILEGDREGTREDSSLEFTFSDLPASASSPFAPGSGRLPGSGQLPPLAGHGPSGRLSPIDELPPRSGSEASLLGDAAVAWQPVPAASAAARAVSAPSPASSLKDLLATSPFGEGFTPPPRRAASTPPLSSSRQQIPAPLLASADNIPAVPPSAAAAAAAGSEAASRGGPQEQQAPTLGPGAAAEGASGSEPGSATAAAAASRHGSGRLELPPRRPEGVVDSKTGNYFGGRGGKPWVPPGAKVGPTSAAAPGCLRRRASPLGSLPVGKKGQVIGGLEHSVTGASISPVLTGESQIVTMTFAPGDLVGSYLGGSAPILAYIESGTLMRGGGIVEINYQADLPVSLSTMAALATGLMPATSAGKSSASGSSAAGQNLTPEDMTNLLLEMDDKLDSVAYGSHLVDVAAAIADRSSMGVAIEREPSLQRAQTLMRTVKQATDRAEQLLQNARVGSSIDGLLVSQRGPNEFLGALVALDPDFIAGRWKMHCVARTQVQVVVMTMEGLGTFLQHNPLAQVHLRAGLARSRSEVVRLEALEKLAGAREHREARRKQALAEAAARRADAQAAAASSSGRSRPSRASSASGLPGAVVLGAASLAGSGLAAAGAAAGGLAGGVAAGVASLDVFGLVSRLRDALDMSQRPPGSQPTVYE